MRYITLVTITAVFGLLCGCENPQLVQCMNDNETLQADIDGANADIQKLQSQNANLQTKLQQEKTRNVEVQTKAMESITSMLTKQAEKDKEEKAQAKQAMEKLETASARLSEVIKENQALKDKILKLAVQLEQAQKQPEEAPSSEMPN